MGTSGHGCPRILGLVFLFPSLYPSSCVLSPTPGSAMIPCKAVGVSVARNPSCGHSASWGPKARWSLMSPPHLPHQHFETEVKVSRGLSLMKLSGFIMSLEKERASLVVQWLRICLPMQATWVRALAWEDPTCRGATKPVRHNY